MWTLIAIRAMAFEGLRQRLNMLRMKRGIEGGAGHEAELVSHILAESFPASDLISPIGNRGEKMLLQNARNPFSGLGVVRH